MSKKQKQLKKTKDAIPRNWDSDAHRRDALDDFLANIKLPGERHKCCSSPQYAKKKFA
jgi:hypothetical protein